MVDPRERPMTDDEWLDMMLDATRPLAERFHVMHPIDPQPGWEYVTVEEFDSNMVRRVYTRPMLP
jgi:hypothetical protein